MQVNTPIEQAPLPALLPTKDSVFKVLAYFDIFSYPITEREIRLFLDTAVKEGEVQQVLDKLVRERRVYRFDNFYSLQNKPFLVYRRQEGNDRAAPMLAKAHKISAFLYRFPFVRGVGISGSLSKNFADKNADIDFFIITRANRLWIARTFMHIFKKLTFLTGRQHWFCMNYYIDEHEMQVSEKNIFTATEVATLVPSSGNGVLTSFFKANSWVSEYFPNQAIKTGLPGKPREPLSKRFIEYCFNNRLGEALDNYLWKITSKRWKRKEQKHKLNVRGGRMGLATGKHYAKPSPEHFQRRILDSYFSRVMDLETPPSSG